MATRYVSRIVLADCSEGKKVILSQEIVSFGSEGGYKTVLVEPSAVVTERPIPECFEEGSSLVFHAAAVIAAVGTEASQ
jgi:hypothetical protein